MVANGVVAAPLPLSALLSGSDLAEAVAEAVNAPRKTSFGHRSAPGRSRSPDLCNFKIIAMAISLYLSQVCSSRGSSRTCIRSMYHEKRPATIPGVAPAGGRPHSLPSRLFMSRLSEAPAGHSRAPAPPPAPPHGRRRSGRSRCAATPRRKWRSLPARCRPSAGRPSPG